MVQLSSSRRWPAMKPHYILFNTNLTIPVKMLEFTTSWATKNVIGRKKGKSYMCRYSGSTYLAIRYRKSNASSIIRDCSFHWKYIINFQMGSQAFPFFPSCWQLLPDLYPSAMMHGSCNVSQNVAVAVVSNVHWDILDLTTLPKEFVPRYWVQQHKNQIVLYRTKAW